MRKEFDRGSLLDEKSKKLTKKDSLKSNKSFGLSFVDSIKIEPEALAQFKMKESREKSDFKESKTKEFLGSKQPKKSRNNFFENMNSTHHDKAKPKTTRVYS